MTNATFDVSSFLAQTITEANDTKIVNVPPGEYNATIKNVEVKQWTAKDGSSAGLKLAFMASIDDPAVTVVTGRAPTNVKAELMLDLTDAGNLDNGKGKNVRLGKLREAVRQNTPGAPFSFLALEGQMVKVKISQRPDPNDSSIVYDEVKAFAPV